VPHPAGLPDLFLDRSLGRIQVPHLLRAQGLRLTTLAEHYGMPQDQEIDDPTWLAEAGRQGWVVLMKDKRIRYKPAELQAVKDYNVRCFCLSSRGLLASVMAERFLRNLQAMAAVCTSSPGPFIYAIQERRMELLHLP